MARDFNGTTDFIDCGSDASVDGFTAYTFACWVKVDTGEYVPLLDKENFNQGKSLVVLANTALQVRQTYDAGVALGSWNTTAQIGTTNRAHIAATFSGAPPTVYINGAAVSVAQNSPPGTTADSGDGESLLLNGPGRLDCQAGYCIWHDRVLTAAEVNRARWWGRPVGGLKVYHPLVTDKLANEGSATADGTATGTTVAAFATPVVRPGMAMMGMGIGW